MPKKLEGKSALITGCTTGIGLATVTLSVKEGGEARSCVKHTEPRMTIEKGKAGNGPTILVTDSIARHSCEQVAYFGPDGLLRRHEYTVDIMGGAAGLNYAADYRNVDGIMVPTKPRVYAPDGNKQKIRNPVLVDIDIGDVAFSADSDAGRTIARRP
jgi:hypothetical protein